MIKPSCFHLPFISSSYILHFSLLSPYYSLNHFLFPKSSFFPLVICYILLLSLTRPLSLSFPAFLWLHCSSLSPHVSQYFDEERDDYEYPYYYEGTTSVPPSVPAVDPTKEVKRESESGVNQKREEEKETA